MDGRTKIIKKALPIFPFIVYNIFREYMLKHFSLHIKI